MATKKAPALKSSAKKSPTNPKTSNKKSDKKKVDEIMARIISEIVHEDDESVFNFDPSKPVTKSSRSKVSVKLIPKIKVPSFRLPKIKSPVRTDPIFVEPNSKNQSLPLVVVAAAAAIVIAGFWGPQIVRALGIPIDPQPFTAIYFQDPKIVETGIVVGDLIVIGVHNGFREERNLEWRILSGTAPLTSGQVSVKANEDSQIAISTAGAIPGELLEIYIEGTSAPITIQVVG